MLRKTLRQMLIGKRRFQPLWERLYRITLSGMNIGNFTDVNDSGEGWVLDYAGKCFPQNQPAVIFDVGANIGGYAHLVLSRLDQTVHLYCFEPSQKTFELLERSLRHYAYVKLYNFGFGSKEEAVSLYSDAEGSGMASVYPRRLYNRGGEPLKLVEKAWLRTIDDFCHEESIGHIHLLKLDVEGHELSILDGAQNLLRAREIDFIQFEFGACNVDSRTYFRDFYKLLRDCHGYDIYRVVKDGLAPIPSYHETREIFYMANYLAVSQHMQSRK